MPPISRRELPELLLVRFRDPTNARIEGLFGSGTTGYGIGIILDDRGG